MRRNLCFAAIIAAGLLLVGAPAFAGHGLPYHAFVELSGFEEVPSVTTDLSGNCSVILFPEDNMLTLSCALPIAPVAAHIHRGSTGVNGPPIITLDEGRIIQQTVTLTEEEVSAGIIGDLYINVHTDAVPSGEIRGQIFFNQVPDTWRMIADGSGAEEETPNDEDNSIQCAAFAAGGDSPILSVHCTHDVDDATAAHLHRAPAGVAGPVVEGFDTATSPISKVFQIDQDTLQDFFDGNLYINVHNSAFPGGIVRANLDNAIDGDNSVALLDGRFQVSVTGSSPFGDFVGFGKRLTNNSGGFTFFSTAIIEQVVKVLDFCEIENINSFGVFISSTTNVAFDVVITDTATGESQTYSNEQGNVAGPVQDFDSFEGCPTS